jgi:putative DNA primase/helicase
MSNTDFNDMAALSGLDAVKRAIANAAASAICEAQDGTENATVRDLPGLHNADTEPDEPKAALLNIGVSEVSGVQASNDGLSADTLADADGVSGVSATAASKIPGIDERPCFRVFDDWMEHDGGKYRPGVWHFGIKPGKNDAPPTPTENRVCSPLHIEAVTFDGQDNNFGRLLRFKNTLGRWREWAMPMELLRGSGDDLRGELLAMGVEIDPTAKTLLANYLQAKPPKRQMRCALQVGWCGDSFVLPDAVIGTAASGVIFQSGERGHDEHTRAGTLAEWREEIAARAVDNPLLLLALSASFAGPMLARCNAEGGGVHFVGDSSTGKTTLLEAGCSIWGGANYRRSWRATANGMEGAAALFNDCLLALDEISECDPREVGAIVYSLGNGRGKQRAGRTGSARAVTRWRCFVLSSGERTIATTMQEGGHRAKAGQAVRLLDIPVARVHGAWDTLHVLPSGTAFSDAIKRASVTHHGHAGRAFLERLTRDGQDLCALLERFKALPEFSAEGGEGQDKRAAGRFALLALAGEMATEYGITGWTEGEAIKAAAECFRVWRAARGHGNDERRQILDRVSGFIERHGDGRFSDADYTGDTPIRDRAGWWRDTGEGREYLFTADGMREALKGFDFKRALDALQEARALPTPGADGRRQRFYRIGGRGVKLYPVQADRLGGDHGAG